MPLGSSPQGRRRLSSPEKTSPALASSGEHAPAAQGGARSNPTSSDVHRIEKSSSGSMSMKDAVELLNDSPRPPVAWTSRRSKDGAQRALLLGHPPQEKLSLRDGEASMEEQASTQHGRARRGERRREWREEDDIGGR
nr:unnamed protein product [Digitaria exilis]